MLVICQNCKEEFEVDETKLPPRKVKSKCLKCGAWIYLRGEPQQKSTLMEAPDIAPGLKLLESEKWEEATEFFKKVFSNSSSLPVVKKILEKYQVAASEKAGDGKPLEAKEILMQGLQLFPKEASLFGLLGHVLVDLKEWKEAQKAYLQALQLDNKDEKLYVALANLYHMQRKPEEEVKVYKMGLSALPKNCLLYVKISQAFLYNGNFAESLQALKKALAIDKTNKAALRLYQKKDALKKFAKGVGLIKKKKFKEAMSCLEKAQNQLSHIPLFPYYKGVCHYMLREFDEAIGNLEKYLHLDAHGPKTEKAISFIQKAIQEVQEIHVNLLLHPLDKCHLIIKSTPKKGQVFLDDQPLGTTPLNLFDQPSGSHFLKIEKDGKVMEVPTIFSGGIAYKIHFNLEQEDCQIEPSLDYELIGN